MKKPEQHRRKLDNVALAFPAATGKKDSRVFRIYCKLREEVDPDVLLEALKAAIYAYPTFHSILKRGNFWYYFESSSEEPCVSEERRVPCSPIYVKGGGEVLYRVTYRGVRINLEIFHALSDGTAAVRFLSEITEQYLKRTHPAKAEGAEQPADLDGASDLSQGRDGHPDRRFPADKKADAKDRETAGDAREQMLCGQQEDSFLRYYSGKKQEKQHRKSRPAYQIRGLRVSQEKMRILECTLSVQELLQKTRRCGVSITEYMTALLMTAIARADCRRFQETKKWKERKPVTLMVPIDLRKYYPSNSMANFFGWMEIECGMNLGTPLSEVLRQVKRRFAEDLEAGQVAARMNLYIRIEKNPLLRFVPLGIKDFFLKIGTHLGSRNVTAVFSNMGVVRLSEAYAPYIDQFGAIASTDKLQMLACSFEDRFYFSISSKYLKTDIQRHLLALLKQEGLRVTIETG